MAERVRFIIDGDASGAQAAFRSVNRGLTGMANSFATARRAMNLFGIAFAVREMKQFVSASIQIEKLTQSQTAVFGDAAKALGALNAGFEDLARTMAAKVAPGFTAAADALNQFLFPSGAQQANAKLHEQIELHERIAQLMASSPILGHDDAGQPKYSMQVEQRLKAMRRREQQLAEEHQALEAENYASPEITNAQAAWDKKLAALGVSIPSPIKMPSNLAKFPNGNVLTGVSVPAPIRMPADLQRWPKEIDDAVAAMDSFTAAQKRAKEEAENLTDALGRGLRDTFVDALLGVETSFSDLLRRMAAELVTSQVFGALATLAGGPATFLGAMFAGARAGGGPVSAGRSYLVGENGPELFMPNQGGQIVANGAGGAAMSITNYNDFRGVDPSSVGRIGMMLERQKRETINAVRDLNNRGRL